MIKPDTGWSGYNNDSTEKQQEVHDKLASWEEMVKKVCTVHELKIRPGKWETF